MSEDNPTDPFNKVFKSIQKGAQEVSRDLFSSSSKDVDLKTDVVYPEDVHIATLRLNDEYLKKRGLNPVFQSYIEDLLRLRFSLDRKSRGEFVQVNTKPLHNLQFPAEANAVKEARQ